MEREERTSRNIPKKEYSFDGIILLGHEDSVNGISNLIQIYHCFCDETRLRILNLLCKGPLCVCHFQKLLEEPQVKISKHLSYLKNRGLVEATRHQNWMVYALPLQLSEELDRNLRCLQDCAQGEREVKQALRRTLLRYKLHTDQDLFDKSYGYIRQYY